jgi:hypothetical protein
MRREQRWIGHRPILPMQAGDVIANGRGPRAAQAELDGDLERAEARHGADVVSKVLCLRSRAVMRFAAFAQGREHASDCEVAGAAALPAGQHGGGHGSGIPVPAAGLCDGEIDDLCNAIVENPRILQEFAEWRAWVRRCG